MIFFCQQHTQLRSCISEYSSTKAAKLASDHLLATPSFSIRTFQLIMRAYVKAEGSQTYKHNSKYWLMRQHQIEILHYRCLNLLRLRKIYRFGKTQLFQQNLQTIQHHASQNTDLTIKQHFCENLAFNASGKPFCQRFIQMISKNVLW